MGESSPVVGTTTNDRLLNYNLCLKYQHQLANPKTWHTVNLFRKQFNTTPSLCRPNSIAHGDIHWLHWSQLAEQGCFKPTDEEAVLPGPLDPFSPSGWVSVCAFLNIPWACGACSWPAARIPVICLNNLAVLFQETRNLSRPRLPPLPWQRPSSS